MRTSLLRGVVSRLGREPAPEGDEDHHAKEDDMPEGAFRKFCRQHTDGFVGEGDDDELDADPGDEEKGSDLELWPFVEELDENRRSKTHEHDAAETTDEHDEELTGVHAADVAPACLRQGDGERNGCENGIDGEGDVCDLDLGNDFPEFFFAVDVIALRIFRQFFLSFSNSMPGSGFAPRQMGFHIIDHT